LHSINQAAILQTCGTLEAAPKTITLDMSNSDAKPKLDLDLESAFLPTAMDGEGNVETIQGDPLAPEVGIRAATIDVKVREVEITDREEAGNKGVEVVKGVLVEAVTIKATAVIALRAEVLSGIDHVAAVRKYWHLCHN
jgi:hypothetical protein